MTPEALNLKTRPHPQLFELTTKAQLEWKEITGPNRNGTVAEALQNYIKKMENESAVSVYIGIFIDLYIKGFEQYMNEAALKLPYGEISEIAILSTICSNKDLNKLYSRIKREPNKYIGGTTVKKLAMLMKAFPDEDSIYELFDYWKTPLESKNAKKVEYTDDDNDMDDIAFIKEELRNPVYIKQLDRLTQKISLEKDIRVKAKNYFNALLKNEETSVIDAIDHYITNIETQYSKSPTIVKACADTFFELCMDNFEIIVYEIDDIRVLIQLFSYYKEKISKDPFMICKANVAKDIYERANHFENYINTIQDFVEFIDLYAINPDYQEKFYQTHKEKLACNEFTDDREYLDVLTAFIPCHEKEIRELAIEYCGLHPTN